MKLYRQLAAVLLCMTAFVFCVGAVNDPAIGWYFKKNDDHTLPSLDAGLSYITEYDGYYADTRVSDDDPVIYLTFDAGYENGNVAKILDVLEEHNAKGTFFVLSHLIDAEPDLVRRMADGGHLVCNHTATHPDLTAVSDEQFRHELSALAASYEACVGREMPLYFRPPEGKFNRRVLSLAREMGYKTIFWSLAYADWDNGKQPNPEAAKKLLLDHTHNGMVLLLHPTSATNAAILDDLMNAWEEMGYRFGTPDELTREETVA